MKRPSAAPKGATQKRPAAAGKKFSTPAKKRPAAAKPKASKRPAAAAKTKPMAARSAKATESEAEEADGSLGPVQVSVTQLLTGDCITFDTDWSVTVAALKEQLALYCDVPVSEMLIMNGPCIANDDMQMKQVQRIRFTVVGEDDPEDSLELQLARNTGEVQVSAWKADLTDVFTVPSGLTALE
eukprot:TRINITY_DN37250_c0_g1_i1.p2 TRINITY_DN37250_c0_g1~~TRINITY_DN37250_c0_g1_i1.p2  ORF type:complete len:184 (-),score=45.66 TRINITY_DN37250_c0_g1_i1:823-1374(-)